MKVRMSIDLSLPLTEEEVTADMARYGVSREELYNALVTQNQTSMEDLLQATLSKEAVYNVIVTTEEDHA